MAEEGGADYRLEPADGR